MIVLKNILVATDFSEPSTSALVYARALARQYGATLHVLHVVEDVAARFVGFPFYVSDLGQVQAEAEKSARARLDEWLTDDDRQNLHAQPIVITSTSAPAAIVEYATQTLPRMDLIVMGTHGRGAVGQFFIGSVAERVVRTAPCPVLTLRTSEREFVAPDAMQTVVHK